jgi:hypothetical protein
MVALDPAVFHYHSAWCGHHAECASNLEFSGNIDDVDMGVAFAHLGPLVGAKKTTEGFERAEVLQ